MPKYLFNSILFLAVTCWNINAAEKPTENLIINSSFEESQEYRPVYHQIGEYRLDCPVKGLAYTAKEYWNGKRALEIAPGVAWSFETTDRYAEKGVFSASIKGAPGLVAEIEVSAVTFDLHTAKLSSAFTSGKFNTTSEWQRVTLPFVNKRKEWSASYTVTVRNTGKAPLWLDAVQLELDNDQASAYSPERYSQRDIDQMRSYKLNPRSDIPDFAGRQGKSGEVKLTLIAPEGASAKLQPVQGGVPFPPGEMFNPARAVLNDANGKNVPCQTTVLARRSTDGSIISLLLNFQAEIKSGESRQYTLKYGGEPVPDGKPIAVLQGDRIVIATGTVTATISKKHFRLFDEIIDASGRSVVAGGDAGAFFTTFNDRNFSSGNIAPVTCSIENNGPEYAVIRVTGKHSDSAGKRLLDYDVRISAFKGMPYFIIEYTLINQETPPDLIIRNAGLRLPVFSGNGKRTFGLVDATTLEFPGATGRTALTQLRQRNGETIYDVLLNLPDGEKRLADTRSNGVATIGDAAVAVADFWQLNPKELAAEPDRLSVYLWPADGVKDIALPFGLAATLRLGYAPLSGSEDIKKITEFPLMLMPDPVWMSATGVFGRFIPAGQARQEFPRFSAIEDGIFDQVKRFHAVSDFNGMFDYGDFGSPAYCNNHETEGVDNLWLRYLRTGDPEIYRLAIAASRHSRDIDVCHIRPGVAARHTHSAGTHTCYNFHTGHFWQSGLLWHYLLTGDRRSFDVAIASGAELVTKSTINYKPGRERSRLLFHLAELYGMTGIVQFRQGFERQYNFGAESNIGHGYYSAISLDCLAKLYEATGDNKYAVRLAADSAAIRANIDACRDKNANIDIDEGRGWHLFKAMGEAAERTGDTGYLTTLNDYFLPYYSVSMTPADYSIATAAPYIYALSRSGVKESKSLPESMFGINHLIGAVPGDSLTNSFRFVIPGGEPFTLRIYKQLKFRSQTTLKYKNIPSVSYRLTEPAGKVVEEGKIEGDKEECAMKVIQVKPSGRGDYNLELNFINDCWGAFSCSFPARLNADRWFFCRYSRFNPVAFWLRAPASGQISVEFRWPYDDNACSGQIPGAALEDETGRLITNKTWTVPMNWRNDNGGKYCTQKLTLNIPRELQGKPVRLFVNDIKWLEWKIDGLDYPWLATVKAGIAR